MSEQNPEPITPEIPVSPLPTNQPSAPKKKTWLIIVIVLIVLCCCVVVLGGVGYYLYTNGDQLFNTTQSTGALLPLFL